VNESMFHGFLDDAAIFPPGLAPLEVAVTEHLRRAENQTTEEFIGPLILSLDKVEEAGRLAGDNSLQLSIVASATDLKQVSAVLAYLRENYPRITVTALELKTGENPAEDIVRIAELTAGDRSPDVFVELSYPAITRENLTALAQKGLSLKFRTGGIRRELFPTPEQVIEVIEKASDHGLRFKLTAGLHRAMRYVDPETGFPHFGFLNIAAATATLNETASAEQALALLNSDDPEPVIRALGTNDHWREQFASFGTCSVAEPADTLADLGLLDRATAEQFH
jgi:hypothetical protein